MKIGTSVTHFAVDRPKIITGVMLLLTACLALGAALPSLWPDTFSALNPLAVDTDPENMLPHDEPVRAYHDGMKEEMALHDMLVLGVVNESDPDGVFNPKSLGRIYELTEYARTLQWKEEDDSEEFSGVIEVDMIAPSMVDNIEQGGLGDVKFEWLMRKPPETREEALAIREKARNIPFLEGTLISEDGKALCLYLPLTSKDVSYKVYTKLNDKIATFNGDDHFHITGLPVAEDTFGVEMFVQMAVSAPLAMLIIFLLMLFFFRKLVLVISPMIVAMVSVICTMGLLVITGNTIHIMSSMIPIFIMPIAVLDAVHILSDFFDRYQKTKDKRKTMIDVMDTLFTPMLYTSLTTAAGFASLALTPIPPVQVFGLFIAFGVMIAWVFTITFIPAYVMFMKDKSFESFGTVHHEEGEFATLLSRILTVTGRFTYKRAKLVLVLTLVLVLVAVYGINRIQINDNPTKWFAPSHPIRVADKVLNAHFGGTYMGYLAFEPREHDVSPSDYSAMMFTRMAAREKELAEDVPELKGAFIVLKKSAAELVKSTSTVDEFLERLSETAEKLSEKASDELYDAWDEAALFVEEEAQRTQIFKQPLALEYLSLLQEHLLTTGIVGKSNSLSDLVKTVHRELLEGDEKEFRIPDKSNAVAQCLLTYQNSHRPRDLWHFVTPDYKKTVIWIQLKSGDNMDMASVVKSVDDFVKVNPPPLGLEHKWFGLTYINVVWQEKMVRGMMQAFLGSFLIVLFMMTVLYRSVLWGMLAMIPLTVTIGLIYGAIGLIGKDYDMPVAVLSSLSLGLAVDYAIHFLARSRELRIKHGSWAETVAPVFGEPARAIARNVAVVGMGFLPLLAAPLVPYQTVGVFIAAILLTAGVASLLILPSMITLLERFLFPRTKFCCFTCQCATCIASGVMLVALVALNVHQFLEVGWTALTWFSIAGVMVLAGACHLMARRDKCNRAQVLKEGEDK
ncbi:RND family transporter [Candidatus Hydrogenedentota bacterium]